MDPTHLHQIVWNLCDNAVKYASATAGAIAVELQLRLPRDHPADLISRSPTAARASSRSKVEEIFEPFYTGQPGGTGLGLYISRELAERNGATLRYHARPGGGSLFRVVFADPNRWQSERRDAMKPDRAGRRRRAAHLRAARRSRSSAWTSRRAPAPNLASAKQALGEDSYDLCLTDMRLPDGDGLELVEWIQREVPGTPVAVITAHGSVEAAVRALKLGAFDFVSKPLDLNDLRKLVTAALKLKGEAVPEGHRDGRARRPIAAIERVRAMVAKVARSQAPVHISGESGTGKELVARMIHESGPRREGPFVPINCGAIPTELMESEFFGHKKGSFTGAVTRQDGARSDRRGRHAVPRRGRRPAAAHAGEAAARDPGEDDSARRPSTRGSRSTCAS